MAPQPAKKRIVVLGATGSIGTSCLDVVRARRDLFEVTALSAHSRWEDLARMCEEFSPERVALTGVDASRLPANAFPQGVHVSHGPDALAEIVSEESVDVVISAIVGAAGLQGTWSAIQAGKTIGLANKETLVAAGPLVMNRLRETGARLIPVDSEHSAIFQALASGAPRDVRRVILTASGGPFRTWSAEKLEQVKVEDALAHPTWEMGPKITVDSATMMNKALEIIEARWLFDLRAEQIAVVVHPQSVVHSMVEFVDGSVIAQMSPPDMKLPIQYALTWPDRLPGISPQLDFTRTWSLDFEPPDVERFPALELGFEVARRGGTSGAVLNAANEIAVSRFMKSDIAFHDIPRLCRSVLEAHDFEESPRLNDVLRVDRWAREEALRWKSLTSPLSPSLAPPSYSTS